MAGLVTADPLEIWYVTMAFPVPSETFVCTEVAALRDAGAEVAVHAMGPARFGRAEILRERGLEALETSHGGAAAVLRGLAAALRHPIRAARLFAFVARRCWRRPGQWLRSLLWMPRTLDLFRQIGRRRPDVVHLFWSHYPAMLGWLVQRYLPDQVLTVSLAAYDLWVEYGCTPPVAARAPLVRTWARVNVPAIEALGVERERIAVHYQSLESEPDPSDLAAPRIAGRVVTASRLIPDKRIDLVLQTVAAASRGVPTLSLEVLGDGECRAELEQLSRELEIDGRTRFAGQVAYDEVFRAMRRAEVFLFLSQHPAERLPNVVKEAIASGCVCIVSATPGIDEIVDHGRTGFIVDAEDVAGAARHVEAVLSGAVDAAAMRSAALEHLQATFDNRVVIPALIADWRRLVAADDQPRGAAPAVSR